jgi:hypothetical protein
VRSLIAHILLSGVKRRRNAFGLTLAEGTTTFDGTGASFAFRSWTVSRSLFQRALQGKRLHVGMKEPSSRGRK